MGNAMKVVCKSQNVCPHVCSEKTLLYQEVPFASESNNVWIKNSFSRSESNDLLVNVLICEGNYQKVLSFSEPESKINFNKYQLI